MKSRSLPILVVFVIAFTFSALTLACSPNTVKRSAATIDAGAQAAGVEIAATVERGELSAEDGARIRAFAGEIGASAKALKSTADGWPAYTSAEKRAAILKFLNETAAAHDRLDAGGQPIFKSERARKRFAEFRVNLLRAEAALRIVEAAIPEQQTASS